MRKFIAIISLLIILFVTGYIAVFYYATYSEGSRSGELIKFSHKGFVFKTWEGEISQGISGAQIFSFSVLDNKPEVIKKLQEYEGQFVKVKYEEKYRTFPWWGDTRYYILEVTPDKSPFQKK
jgi:hypothetical protein